MPKITKIGRSEHVLLSTRMAELLAPLEAEFGVKLNVGGGQYGQGTGMVRVNVEVQDTGSGMSASEQTFRLHAGYVGLKPEWFGASFYYNGQEYRVVGLNLGAPKYPVNVERVHDKKAFKMTASMVKIGIEAEVAKGRIAA